MDYAIVNELIHTHGFKRETVYGWHNKQQYVICMKERKKARKLAYEKTKVAQLELF